MSVRAGILAILIAVMPCLASDTGEEQGVAGPIELPMELVQGAVIVQVMVNGLGPFDMMLDTGANPSVVDLDMARKIHLKLAGQGQQGSGGGTDPNPAYATELPELQLGGLTVQNVAALALDLSKLGAALGRPLQGALGYSLFKDRVVQFDYPHRKVRFLGESPVKTAGSSGAGEKAQIVSFRIEDDILIDDSAVNGRKLVATLDTGSNASFQLTAAAVKTLGLEDVVARAQASHSVGFNGRAERRTGTVDSVKIGGLVVDHPPVVFLGSGTGNDDQAWGLRIGSGFLKDYVVTVDYRRKLLEFSKPK